MSKLTRALSRLSPQQRTLLERRLKAKRTQSKQLEKISSRDDLTTYPLSFSQERLWFLDQLEPGATTYNMPAALRLKGNLDVAALERGLAEIVRRHQTLRATFASREGQAVQRVSRPGTFTLPLINLQGLPPDQCEAEARLLADREALHIFDLSQGPLFRAGLLRLGNQEHIFLVNMHHIISDGWSLGVLVRELGALYQAFSVGEPSPLPELPIQYADFAHWQRQWLQGEALERQLAYWEVQLGGDLSILDLPADHPRPAVQTFRGAAQSSTLSPSLTQALKALSNQEEATLFMTLLAAFKVLLYHYTGQEDIIVGSPVANRNRVEVEGLIGFFVNVLALRSDLSGNPSFLTFLQRERRITMGAYAHQDVPFEQLLTELQPERDLSRTPLFQVFFNMLSLDTGLIGLPGLAVEFLSNPEIGSKFDITLYAIEKNDGLSLRLYYNTDLFDSLTISCMLERFQTLLAGIVANPEQRIAALPILTGAEQAQLPNRLQLIGPTNSFTPFDRAEIEQSIPARFEQQVRAYPQQIAVKSEQYEWSYAALNLMSNRVAHTLLRLCGEGEGRVALLFEHDAPMLVGIFGTLKAGKTYVPLDPTYPQERLAYMLENSGATVLLTNDLNLTLGESLTKESLQLLDIDQLSPTTADHNPGLTLSPHTLAYILYTSGSTGQPKGVMQNHRNVLYFMSVYTNNLHINAADRLTLLSSYSFDAAIMDIFGALLNGATLYPLNVKETAFTNLARRLREQAITIYHSTPTVYRYFVSALAAEETFPRLRLVVLGGEAVYKGDVERYKKHFAANCLFINGLGPTESTLALQYFIDKQTQITRHAVPVGYSVAETEVVLLNQAGEPVPIFGEIGIRSAHVAPGYWQDAALSRAVFQVDPDDEGKRIYCTGDMGRLRPDGSLEFVGRKDFQVKIRGYRIETSEIETRLLEHKLVQEAAVLAWEDGGGDKHLVAYLVPDPAQRPDKRDLRHFLQQRLPDYMVPGLFVMLEGMPLTPTGKTDRRALPEPHPLRFELEEGVVAPRTPLEDLIAGIWADVLGLNRIGIHSNFFDLGGHSLLATQIVARIREAAQVDLPLRSLFEAPTVAGLAEQVEAARQVAEGLQALPLRPCSRDQEILLSFSQLRQYILEQLDPATAAYNLPLAARLRGAFNVTVLEQSLNEIFKRHESLRTSFVTSDEDSSGEPLQVIAPPAPFKLEVIDLQRLPEAEREGKARQLATAEAQYPFDLAQGPLVRVRLLKLDESDYILLATMHHIVSDGWSISLFIRELGLLYPAFLAGEPSPLPDLPIQYADFAHWQRQWLQDAVLEAQLTYWQEQLGPGSPVLKLPTDRPRPAVQTFSGARIPLTLPRSLSEAIRQLSRQEGATLFMTLLTAFKTLLYRYSGQEDMSVGTFIANRNRNEIAELIGFFVNTLVMRTDLSGDPTMRGLLGQVREVALGAYAHQDLPFEKLLEVLQPERDLSHTPLFQVMFVLQNVPASTLDLPGLTLSVLPAEHRRANFDLTLWMYEPHNTAGQLSGALEYNTDLFDETTINRMLAHFRILLENMVADPDQTISTIPILTEGERHRLLVEWNATQSPYIDLLSGQSGQERCIHHLFEAQAARTPDAIAIIQNSKSKIELSYRALNQRANQLARFLQRLGVGPEVRVGICIERSIEMIVGLLGVLKAGGAYVPLDPALPEERLIFMLQDAAQTSLGRQVSPGSEPILLTQKVLAPRFSDLDTTVIYLDTDWEIIAGERTENPASAVTAANLAYVIYTSGSTGSPKGTMLQHRSLVAFTERAGFEYALEGGDRVLQFASLSFDTAVEEIYPCLTRGATLVLRTDSMLDSPPAFLQKCQAWQLTVLDLPTAYWHELVVALPAEALVLPEGVRLVIIGGEQALLDRLKLWHDRLGQRVQLLNTYGPTEATVVATMHNLTVLAAAETPLPAVPIGRPLPGVEVYVLDHNLQPVPIGMPGELYLGGIGLARGYLNRPDLTAEKFIPHPFPDEAHPGMDEPGPRLYKTGDLVRYLPDGVLEFLGRTDDQVKIRGFRVELGEIEAVLDRHPAVRQSLVLAYQSESGHKRLAAYLVTGQEKIDLPALRRFMAQKMPDYMVPASFTLLDALPLTASGKINRRALPLPDQVEAELTSAFVSPRTPAEATLAEIWAEILSLTQVGIYDNFFELGGHSLLAMRLISRIRIAFAVELPLQRVFETPTVADLALLITQQKVKEVDSDRLAELLAELDELSPEEVQAMLDGSG